jgi:hypothetical protein
VDGKVGSEQTRFRLKEWRLLMDGLEVSFLMMMLIVDEVDDTELARLEKFLLYKNFFTIFLWGDLVCLNSLGQHFFFE